MHSHSWSSDRQGARGDGRRTTSRPQRSRSRSPSRRRPCAQREHATNSTAERAHEHHAHACDVDTLADPVHRCPAAAAAARLCVAWLLRHRAVTAPSSTHSHTDSTGDFDFYVRRHERHSSDGNGNDGPRTAFAAASASSRIGARADLRPPSFFSLLFSSAFVVDRSMPSRGPRSSARATRTGEWTSTATGVVRMAAVRCGGSSDWRSLADASFSFSFFFFLSSGPVAPTPPLSWRTT